MITTLEEISRHRPCGGSWERGLKFLNKLKADDEVLEFTTILEAVGSVDTIWCLRVCNGYDKEIRLFACDMAEFVLPYFEEIFPGDYRPRKAIKAGRRLACGGSSRTAADADADSAAEAASAAHYADAHYTAAHYAAAHYAAASAASSARYVAAHYAAARATSDAAAAAAANAKRPDNVELFEPFRDTKLKELITL